MQRADCGKGESCYFSIVSRKLEDQFSLSKFSWRDISDSRALDNIYNNRRLILVIVVSVLAQFQPLGVQNVIL